MENKKVREIYKVFDEKSNFLARQTVQADQNKLNRLFENLYSPGPSFQYIFDIVNRRFTFLSENIRLITGEDPDQFQVNDYVNRIHPDDFQHFVHCEEVAGYFLFKHIEKKDIPNYKLSYQIRFKDSNNNYRLHLRQSIALSVDEDYNLSTVFTNQSDISHITTHNNHKISFIHVLDGKSYFGIGNIKDFDNNQPKLEISSREVEIVKLISEGFSSKEIADYLHISLDTVHTHRKNILSKTNFKNMTQAATHYVREGLI
ncbi:response regulator transcription factor [Allomuricauda sp. SCSIO 65647]|uniref:response regulator transcription factor n=1 Tax=Allomuricauda sp. SCSIO 65647 TaxID=2908843 RepID=UPI001F198E8A|nr:LuxR C-terminal-related transcriptional regulator [Muricauda sp. SCSIO 65647]UJH67640.1 LuxR C-terminal-related transcriptional regulator [Muricauda sp. SCSIO 65647]